MDDNGLMAQVQQGDQDAFEALVLRHYEGALRQAQSILHEAALAQDAVQESFADLYAHRYLYKPTFAFTTYLSALVRHKSIDLLRRQRRFPLPKDPDTPLPAAEDSAEARCIADAFAHGLAGFIDGLPPLHRQIIVGYAVEGKDYRTLAEETGCSLATVKVTLHRIRKKLRQIKEEWK